MDESKVKEIVDENIEKLMRLMGVPHWKVSIEYGPCDLDYHSAQVKRIVPYNIAEITIDPSEMKDEEDLIKTLVHELAHIVVSPFDLYRNVRTAGIREGSRDEKAETQLWIYCVEQAVINVTRVYIMMKQHYEGRIESMEGGHEGLESSSQVIAH